MELIKISEQNGKQVISARELYETLGFNKAVWSRWAKKNIIENPFAMEGQDWIGFNTMLNGNETQDFAITLDFAKRLSMLARTDKGEEVRRYFIKCEELAKQKQLPQSLSRLEILQIAIEAEQKALMLEQKVELQQKELTASAPKVKYHDEVLSSDGTVITNVIAKELGMSAVTLNKYLHDLKVIYKQGSTWLLYQNYQNKGYAKTKTYTYTDSQGKTQVSIQLVWTQKGREFLHKVYDNVIKQKIQKSLA